MDLSVTRGNVRLSEPVFDGPAEHPMECDILLPDYCPDIARILKTESEANVDSKTLEPGKMTLNGTFTVRIIYIPENAASIRCVTHDEPFTHVFPLKEAGKDTNGSAGARVAFVNCRPTGPRRVQIKASVGLWAKVWETREENFVSDCETEGIELLKKPMKACSPVGAADRPFKVNDEVEIPSEKPAAASIVRTTATAVLQDYKVISNKIIAKGEVLLKTLYAADGEDGKLENITHSIPVSQIIDLDGVDEDCRCDVHFQAGDVKTETENDPDGDNRILTYEVNVGAQAKAFREQEFFTVSDAFSTQYNMELKSKPINFEHINSMGKFNEMLRFSLDAPGLTNVADCALTPSTVNLRFEGKAMVVEGNMDISVLASDNAGSPASIEKTMPFALREELAEPENAMRCDPELTITAAEANLAGDKLEIRAECTLEAAVYGVRTENVVTDMSVDDTKEKECPRRKTLTLYYADKGERIWDIAKRYNTSMNAILRENDMDCDELEDRRMLLIPRARCHMK